MHLCCFCGQLIHFGHAFGGATFASYIDIHPWTWATPRLLNGGGGGARYITRLANISGNAGGGHNLINDLGHCQDQSIVVVVGV